ncbi:MAG: hypothetical protein QOD96_7256 [Pseudonocardiales bacterium]|nr:hypothetical protein [Pseudonocardiales bacterium]
MTRRAVSRAVLLLLSFGVAMAVVSVPAWAADSARVPNAPTLPIEQKYFAHGPWAVTSTTAVGCCDSSGSKFDVWYPADLGRSGTRHAVITWGNGTFNVPSQYAYLLAHLASWGFVVVATEDSNTGSGQQILDAAHWLVRQDSRPSSPFYHRLATARVGAIGHSQGAAGALNAMIQSDGLITTAVLIETPAQILCGSRTSCPDTRKLTGGAIFLVNGSADQLISPSTQPLPWALTGLQSNSAYYDAAPASVTKAWATLDGPSHNDVTGQPGCAPLTALCFNGVYGYLGYPTAWLMDRLRHDHYAHQAFVAQTGELFRERTNWSNQHSNITH